MVELLPLKVYPYTKSTHKNYPKSMHLWGKLSSSITKNLSYIKIIVAYVISSELWKRKCKCLFSLVQTKRF